MTKQKCKNCAYQLRANSMLEFPDFDLTCRRCYLSFCYVKNKHVTLSHAKKIQYVLFAVHALHPLSYVIVSKRIRIKVFPALVNLVLVALYPFQISVKYV